VNKTYGLLSGMLAAALAVVVLVGCTTAQAAPQAAATPEAPVSDRYITVVGIGQVSLVPDIAEVNVGVEAAANTVAEAKAEVDRHMEAILTVLKEMGIAEKDIQTSHYSIYFEREPSYIVPREETSQASEGGVYRVSNMLQVTIRDLGKVSQLIDAVVEAGANQMYGVSFTVSDDAAWQSQAREKAMADAQARAEELAGLASVELGQVLSVSEVVGGSPYYAVQREAAYGGAGIAPGELEFSAQIQVTFAIQ